MLTNVQRTDVELNSGLNGFQRKDEPKKTFATCTKRNLEKRGTTQEVALLSISFNVKERKNLISRVQIRTPDEQAWA